MKPLLNPVDYIGFKGMSANNIKSVCLLDRKVKPNTAIQRSIERCVANARYEWLTLRISDDGQIKTE